MENGHTETTMNNGHHEGAEVIIPSAKPETSAASAPKVAVMDYQMDFPALPENSAPVATRPAVSAWSRPVVASKIVESTLILSPDERANKAKTFGSSTSDEHKKCQHIAHDTETTITLNESRDGALTVLIKGARNKVEEARARVVRDLQTQASREIEIPKDHLPKLIGKEGSALRQLEADTNCKIIVPKRDAASHAINIIGTREGIEKAVAFITNMSERESKLGYESIVCPKIYYPWVRGANNELLDKLMADTGAKVNIPPQHLNNEVITISGEKEGVHKAADVIRSIVADRTKKVKSITCNMPRAQHRFIIGSQRSGLFEIFRETDVWVEMPNEEEESDVITLRGDPAKFGEAMGLVLKRASSVIASRVEAPNWLHKYLIGPKGATLQSLIPDRSKVHVDFEDSGSIFLEGSPEEVKKAHDVLSAEATRLLKEYTIEKVKAHPSIHRHVIGRGGSLISKIKEDTGVQITIPGEQLNSDEITVEGKKDGVKKAVQEITAIVSKIENEKSRDIIIEQRLHKLIIGTKGETVGKIRDAHPNVVMSFPDATKKSDIITLRGDKNEVDKVYKALQTLAKDLLESNYQQTVPVFKDFIKHIVGKGGVNVKKIRDETQTRIDMPEKDNDKIIVTGKKANVEKAIAQLESIQNELASVVSVDIDIPVKVQSRLLGGGRRLISDIQDECGGVHIKFPAEKSESTKVSIRGPKDDVEKAQKLLTALAKDKELNLLEEVITCKPEYHKFLIGKGGSKINKLRESYDVRIIFPKESDTEKEAIHLYGKKEDVPKVKAELEEAIKQLNETVEIKVEVDSKHHKIFLVRGAAFLKEIQEQNGGVAISFPKNGSESNTVTIKGSKQCAESAKARIEEAVEDIEKQVSINIDIPAQFHRALLFNRGQKIQEIQSNYHVQIRFPDRRKDAESPAEENETPDRVIISGRDTKCEAAKTALLALVPVSKTINVPQDMHGSLIGRGGETVRKLMQSHEVNVSFPRNNESEEITVTGQTDAVDSCLAEIQEKIKEYESQAEDRRLKSFEVKIDIPSEYHTKIIGAKGATVNALRTKYEVQIALPKGDNKEDTITIIGYEEKARACATEIEEMVAELRSLFTQDITLDPRFHPRLIGAKGRNLKKVQEDYGVEIRLSRDQAQPDLVTISGKSEDSVYDCIDYLRAEEEDFLAENQDRHQYTVQRVKEHAPAAKPVPLQMTGAPWQNLNITSSEDFPDMGAPAPAQAVGAGAWGGARRW